MKTVMCVVSTVACCFVTLALTMAAPTQPPSTTTEADVTGSPAPQAGAVVGQFNGSKLVITQVVKTVEFVVGLEEDDNSTEYSTESTTPFIETDLNVLNPGLLKALIKAQEAQEASSTENSYMDGTKDATNESQNRS